MAEIYNSFIRFLLPEICIAFSAIVILLGSLYIKKRNVLTVISILGLLAAAACTYISHYPYIDSGILYCSGLLTIDTLTFAFRLLFIGIVLFVVLGSNEYSKKYDKYYPEFLVLVHLALVGMSLLVSAYNFISLFASLELMALSFYGLTALMKDKKSSEASLKYILLGGVNSAILLFGLVLLFGFTGEVSYDGLYYAFANGIEINAGLIFAAALVLCGFAFKVAAVPFHMWAPEVYDGSPTSVTMYLSTGSKLAGMVVLFRVVYNILGISEDICVKACIIVAILSILSMFIGNFGAMAQKNVKKMLAFSGVCQTGYMLITIASLGLNYEFIVYNSYSDFVSLFLFALAFALAEVTAFTGIMSVACNTESDLIESYRGLAKKSPYLAVVITIALLSLMGLPATAGFIGKFVVFTSINNVWIVVIGVLNSVLSAVYYLRFIRVMWTGESEYNGEIKVSELSTIVMTITATLLIGIGIIGFNLF